jgi:phthalate 4,5-cis-dihydrodiol dehydrogenase
MREIIASGELGRVGMVNTWCYTDWLYRPRRTEELDASLGGGTLFRQGAHQFDVLRLLCGGQARSVRAQTFDWDPQRRSVGAHMAFVEFEDGVAASAAYNGYGGLSSTELCSEISEWGFQRPAPSPLRGTALIARNAEQELQAKRERASSAIPAQAPYQPFFGLTVVSCERGDIRQSPTGLLIYSAQGKREEVLPTDKSPRDLVLAEFFAAIQGKKASLHDGRWGLATLELCVAAMQSAQTRQSVALLEQVAEQTP